MFIIWGQGQVIKFVKVESNSWRSFFHLFYFVVSPVTATQQQARDNLQQQLEQQLGQSQIRTQTAIQSNQPQTTLQTNVQKPSNQNTIPQSQATAAAAPPQQKKGLSLTVSSLSKTNN